MRSAQPQLWLELPLPQSRRLSDFIVGPNTEALARVRKLAEGALPGFQAVWLEGPQAAGKSHLLQGACDLAATAGITIAYLPAARMPGPEALDGLQGFGLVALDDVDLLLGERGWEEALMALYQGLQQQAGRLLLASRHSAAAVRPLLPDLGSRLRAAEGFRLQPLPESDLARLLRMYAARTGLALPDEVTGFLLHRLPRTQQALLSALDELDQAALARQRRLTVPFVKEVLHL